VADAVSPRNSDEAASHVLVSGPTPILIPSPAGVRCSSQGVNSGSFVSAVLGSVRKKSTGPPPAIGKDRRCLLRGKDARGSIFLDGVNLVGTEVRPTHARNAGRHFGKRNTDHVGRTLAQELLDDVDSDMAFNRMPAPLLIAAISSTGLISTSMPCLMR
jgi:hypothetical protein